MERIGVVAGGPAVSLDEMRAKLETWRQQAAHAHLDRMARLPPGTCERCYGAGRWGGHPCGDCATVTTYAEGTPYEFHGSRFQTYSEEAGNQAALAKAKGFLESAARRDLYLTGGIGAGKTRLATAVLNEAVSRGRWCYFARVPMVLHRMQPGKPSDDLEHTLMRCDLLVLDDLAAERDQATDYTRRTLLMLYEERGDRGVRTIFTSNKTLQQLAEMQDDDRLASRIAGRADVVKLTTPDQRLRRAPRVRGRGDRDA